MNDELPQGWVKTTLRELCLPVDTIQPKDSPDSEFTYFDIGGIDNVSNRIAETKIIKGRDAPSRARQFVRKGDILFSTVRTYLRKIARIERDYPNPVASTGFTVIRAADGVSSEFLFFQLLSDDFLTPVHKLQTGSSYPAVRDSDVFSQPILLPPTYEQERIASKLSAALLRLQRAETAARRARVRVDEYCDAVLNSAVMGEFSRDWRSERKGETNDTGENLLQQLLSSRRTRWEEAEIKRLHAKSESLNLQRLRVRYHAPTLPREEELSELPEGWIWVSIDQLSWASSYGTSVKCTYEADGPPVLRIPNIKNREVDLEDLKFATESQDFDSEDFVGPGDLLVIRTNGSRNLVGRAAIIKSSFENKYGFASYLIRFRLVGDESLWSWLSYSWDSRLVREKIEARSTTTAGQYNVSLSRLADLGIPLPARQEQTHIIQEVERRLTAAERLAVTLDEQLARARAMRQTLLSEALTGKFVAQDPKDEQASVLLERIRTILDTETQKQKAKPMRKAKPKSKNIRRPLIEVLREYNQAMTPEQLFAASGYLQEFKKNEYRQEVVDKFYEELKEITRTGGPVLEKRPDVNTVLLELKP